MVEAIIGVLILVALVAGLIWLGINLLAEHCEQRRRQLSKEAVIRAMKIERPAWADRGSSAVTVETRSDGAMMCRITATFAFGDTKVDYIERKETIPAPKK